MSGAWVTGLGLWTPGYDSPSSWCDGKPDEAHGRPEAALLEGAVKRRASLVTRIGVEVLDQAARMGGADLSRVATVWGTANGESTVTVELLAMMQRGEGRLSPTRFHNSVHNAAAGCASIACGNERFSTTLSGGAELVGTCLLEALLLLDEGESDVVVVLADETYAPPLGPDPRGTPLGVAFQLTNAAARPTGSSAATRRPLARLANLRFSGGDGEEGDAEARAASERFPELAIAAALPLMERVMTGRPATGLAVQASDGPGPRWRVDVERA